MFFIVDQLRRILDQGPMFTETHGPRRHTNFLRFYVLFVFMAGRLLCLDTERPESSSHYRCRTWRCSTVGRSRNSECHPGSRSEVIAWL